MRFMKSRNLLTVALAIPLFCWVPAHSQDVNGLLLTVNSTADSRDALTGDRVCADEQGRCTLRAAVEETNSNATRDAIIFDIPQPSVIELTFGELFLVQSLDILGPGARRLTIQRAGGTIAQPHPRLSGIEWSSKRVGFLCFSCFLRQRSLRARAA